MRLVLILGSVVLFSATAWGEDTVYISVPESWQLIYNQSWAAYRAFPDMYRLPAANIALAADCDSARNAKYVIDTMALPTYPYIDSVYSDWSWRVDTVRFAARPALTIYYVDTVGWRIDSVITGWTSTQYWDSAHYGAVWLPILDTTIVGTVHIDKMPDKHKQLHIRKDQ